MNSNCNDLPWFKQKKKKEKKNIILAGTWQEPSNIFTVMAGYKKSNTKSQPKMKINIHA